MTEPSQLTKTASKSIVIVIEADGSHYICVPSDEETVFSSKAIIAVSNALTAITEPSVVLRAVLWIERNMKRLSTKLFGE